MQEIKLNVVASHPTVSYKMAIFAGPVKGGISHRIFGFQ